MTLPIAVPGGRATLYLLVGAAEVRTLLLLHLPAGCGCGMRWLDGNKLCKLSVPATAFWKSALPPHPLLLPPGQLDGPGR